VPASNFLSYDTKVQIVKTFSKISANLSRRRFLRSRNVNDCFENEACKFDHFVGSEMIKYTTMNNDGHSSTLLMTIMSRHFLLTTRMDIILSHHRSQEAARRASSNGI
jgi:hypothetical protein